MVMQVIYTGEEMPEKVSRSLFLAGPSLRQNQLGKVDQWRQDALKILEDIGWEGIVYCPENRDNKFSDNFNYDNQVEWEDKFLNAADCIVFWVSRDLSEDKDGIPKLPAFTTNIEYGAWCQSGKVVFGAPENADKVTYLKHYAEKYKVPIAETLTQTLRNALDMLEDSHERVGGERFIPLFIWNTPSFQSWYKAQSEAGNKLEHAQLLYNFRPGYGKNPFLWILKVAIYIASEDRIKDNEFVLARTDISSILLWKPNKDFYQSQIVLIREFRSPASTQDGFIRELIGGSSHKPNVDPKQIAFEEVYEETGFKIDADKLQLVTSRQLFGTLSSHKSYLYNYKLDEDELQYFISQDGIVHGNEEDTERTFIEIYTIQELLNNNLVDWSNLGMILSVAMKENNEFN